MENWQVVVLSICFVSSVFAIVYIMHQQYQNGYKDGYKDGKKRNGPRNTPPPDEKEWNFKEDRLN